MLPVTLETLRETAWYAAIPAIVAVLSLPVPKERRPSLWPTAFLAIALWGGLWLLWAFGARFQDRTLYEILREAAYALLAVAVLRSVLIFVSRVLLARFAIPSIVTDVLLGLGLIVYALVRLNVVGVNLAGIVTTSAVITGAIAFSAQEVLAALWAGMALQAERTIRLGDWIRVGQSTGQVVGIRWRATSILTRANEVIIVPNVQLIRNPVHVLGRGTTADLPLRILSFPVDYAHPPSLVVRMINDALRRAELANVASDPAPACVCVGFGERGADYEVLYHILDLRRFKETDSEVYSHVFVALKRCGMRIPPPRLDMTMQRGTPEAALERTARMAAVAEFDLAASLTEDERRALADELVTCPFADGDILFRQNEPADSLYILAHGRLDVVDDSHGSRQKLATIEAPSYVGEMGLLTGQARLATVIADGDVVCYRLHKTGFDAILRNRPQIVEELSAVLARRQAENEAMMAALDASEAARRAPNRTADLVRRIRQFFVLG